jgi:prepilin-type N-terminal cleavage/methylation domain-containing protein
METSSASTVPRRAFTLIELLVVMAIIALLAGMIVALMGVTGDKKAISTTRARIEELSTLVEVYKLKTGAYPPAPLPTLWPGTEPTNSSLFYELISMELTGPAFFSNKQFQVGVRQSDLQLVCGTPRIFNSVRPISSSADIEDRKLRAYSFLQTVNPRQTNMIEMGGQRIIVFVAPADGPNGERVNPIRYTAGTNATHNPDSFDLWAVIKTKSGPKIIGNWKD